MAVPASSSSTQDMQAAEAPVSDQLGHKAKLRKRECGEGGYEHPCSRGVRVELDGDQLLTSPALLLQPCSCCSVPSSNRSAEAGQCEVELCIG